MAPSTESRSAMCGPWRLFRIVLRIVIFGVLTWFLLALLWAFLPSPTTEHDGDRGSKYPTAVLHSGKSLTRVYDSGHFRVQENDRQGFALDYKLDFENLTISIGEHVLPIINDPQDEWPDVNTKQVDVVARTGDLDGANLPWFPFADSVLLFWWIHKENTKFPVSVHWMKGANEHRVMEVFIAERHGVAVGPSDNHQKSDDSLLMVEITGEDTATIVVTVPERPLSSSPSITYPIRIAIIHIIAPTAVFVNDLLGNTFGAVLESIVMALFVILVVFLYGFLAFCVLFSLWRCFGGPSYENTIEGIQGRLLKLSQNEKLRFLKIDVLQEKLESLCQNERFKMAVYICRNGWHPERERARATEEEEADIEKAPSGKQ